MAESPVAKRAPGFQDFMSPKLAVKKKRQLPIAPHRRGRAASGEDEGEDGEGEGGEDEGEGGEDKGEGGEDEGEGGDGRLRAGRKQGREEEEPLSVVHVLPVCTANT